MAPGILFDRVWKKFRRGERHDSLRDLIPALLRRTAARGELQEEEFWAVRDVSFEVGPGDSLAIIGPNGAGKSTILKLLTRILPPTHGRCEIHGRAGALIEIAAGFHPDLTGRENVFLQGSIMGMSRADIARQFDRIVEFSGVADFIDTPVKRYSSGMNARLGFAIAAHLEPDVLIIDEVLSVGDAAFQEQCIQRMRELCAGGVPLVFVSHNLPAVVDLCRRGIVLSKGCVEFAGTAAEAVRKYRTGAATRRVRSSSSTAGPIRITAIQVLDGMGRSGTVLRTGAPLRVRIHYDAPSVIEQPCFAVDILAENGTYCCGISTRLDRWNTGSVQGAGTMDLVIPTLPLLRGVYAVTVGIHDAHGARVLDLHERAVSFSVVSDRRDLGAIYVEHTWDFRPGDRLPEEATS